MALSSPLRLPPLPVQVAIVCDWLTTYGGAEHVIVELHRTFPSSTLFTTVERRGSLGALSPVDLRTSALQSLYQVVRRHQWLLPLMPRRIESWDLHPFDIVLSSSHAVGKGCLPPPSALHLCYCHTPMRYAWFMEEDYLRDFGVRGPLRHLAKRALVKLRRWDLTTSRRVDLFLANSTTTQERIRRIYGRDSVVLHPPIDDRFFHTSLTKERGTRNEERSYYLAIGRLVPYKRFDLLIAVANQLRLPLVIAGEGRECGRLRTQAGPTVTFLGRTPDANLPALYAGARALLFPTEEDAGIVPLEAQACGAPVIALRKGGVIDTVREGITGVLFPEQTPGSLLEAIQRFERMTFDRCAIREHAKQFSATRFRERLGHIVTEAYEQHRARWPR